MTGAKVVLPGPHPSTEDQLKLIESEQVSIYLGAFVVIMFAIQEWESGKYDLSSLKTIISGASAPEKTLIDAMDQKGIRVFIGYGSAEARTLATASSSSEIKMSSGESREVFLDRMVLQGQPVPGIEMRVENLDTGEEVSRDGKEMGEVLVRGLWIGQEYYDHPEGTSVTFKDDWLHTGDVGVVHEDGTLCLVDRVKDVIKSGGEWISSVDLENAIMANPAVRHVAVIGVPHSKWQERPAAVIILKDDYKGKVSEQDILKALDKKVAKWWIPDHVAFVDELPMTGTMKILKRELREDWINGKLKETGSSK
jgi:fatty-acyl-CoA synthase